MARQYVEAGYDWGVDVEKFFDRVNHDILMAWVARKVKDKRVLKLIRRFLQAGVMLDGVVVRTEEGTPQGGPLSLLLANIYLDDLDKELEKRGNKHSGITGYRGSRCERRCIRPCRAPKPNLKRGGRLIGVFFAGIDWADDHHDVVILSPTGSLEASFRVTHSSAGLKELIIQLRDLTGRPKDVPCFCRACPTLEAVRAAHPEEIATLLKKLRHPRPNETAQHTAVKAHEPQLHADPVTNRAKARLMLAIVAQLAPLVDAIREYDKAIDKVFTAPS